MDQPTRRITRSQTQAKKSEQQQHHISKQNGVYQNGTTNNDMKVFSEKVSESVLSAFIYRVLMPLYLIIQSPILVVVLCYIATKCNGSLTVFVEIFTKNGFMPGVAKIWNGMNLYSNTALFVILGYSAFAAILQVCVPGPKATGPITPKGNIPIYKDNGFYCFIITVTSFLGLTYALQHFGGPSPTIIYDRFDEFLGTVTIISLIFCLLLYIKGLVSPSFSDHGSSGNPLFDYYWGMELYPRIFGVDVKVFTNCRFGMTVWPLLCMIFTLKSCEVHGFVDSIWLSCILQMIYFLKFFWWEAGYMSTIDVMVDRAGFYICWGCLAYVPGLYASPCMFMVNNPVHLGPVLSTIIFICGVLSIGINYWADYQKQIVRKTNGNCTIWGSKPEIIRAKYKLESGAVKESILLVSGFWGVARHFHYVPELMLAFFWCATTLLQCGMTYGYFVWLCFLLVHRTYRDDRKCRDKYGRYWNEYCKRVPYKMIPGVF